MTTVYDIVTEQILKALDNGEVVWRKQWSTAGSGLPRRLGSSKTYSAMNCLLLMLFNPYGSPYYVTFKQAKAAGAKIRKDEKSHIVTALFPRKQENEVGEEYVDWFRYRYYRVFNVEQLENLGSLKVPALETREFSPIQTAENLLAGMSEKPVIISEGIQAAFYRPSQDIINMPLKETFSSDAAYYSVLFHEMIHWTGAASRLERLDAETAESDISNPYAFEELVAEIGAAMLLAHCEINDAPARENTVAYLNGWRKKLGEDKTFIIRAAAAAQKAVNFILGNTAAAVQEDDEAEKIAA